MKKITVQDEKVSKSRAQCFSKWKNKEKIKKNKSQSFGSPDIIYIGVFQIHIQRRCYSEGKNSNWPPGVEEEKKSTRTK